MKTITRYLLLVFSLGLMLPSYSVFSEEQTYGRQLMTEQERNEHRLKMQSMKTKEARERYRMEHHEKMQERAKQQGVTLPEAPMPRGNGMRDGSGMGGGSGGGMGSGMGGGRGR